MPGGCPASRSAADAGWRRRFCKTNEVSRAKEGEKGDQANLRLDVAVDDVL
jgi:cation transport regulator ChaC